MEDRKESPPRRLSPPMNPITNNNNNNVRRHVRIHSSERCLLHIRSEVLWDGIISNDLLHLRRSSSHSRSHSSHNSSPLKEAASSDDNKLRLSPQKDDSYAMLSPWLLQLAQANKSASLNYSSWVELAQSMFQCTEESARLYFETFILVHNSHYDKASACYAVDMCEFLVFLYLQQHWPKYQRNYRSINRARHQVPSSPHSPRSPTRSPVHGGPQSPVHSPPSQRYTFTMGSDDELKDAVHMKHIMMDVDVGIDVEGETEAEETFEEMTHFLRLHLTNILCLLKDPIQLQLAAPKFSVTTTASSTDSPPVRAKLHEYNASKKSHLPPPHTDIYSYGSSSEQALITLQSHEFDRLALLLTFDMRDKSHRLSELTPFWKSHPFTQVSVSTLREWVLRYVHPLPLVGLRPLITSSTSSIVWSCAYPNIHIGLLSHASQETILCDDEQLKNGDFHLKDCIGCTIILTGYTRYVSITNCNKCTVNVGAVGVLVRINDCQNLVLSGVSNHVRISNCKDSIFYIFSGNRPIVIGGNNVTLGPFNKASKALTTQLERMGVLQRQKQTSSSQWICTWDTHCWMKPMYISVSKSIRINSTNSEDALSRPSSSDTLDDNILDDTSVSIMKPQDFVFKCEFCDDVTTTAISNESPLPIPKSYIDAIQARNKRVHQFRQKLGEYKLNDAEKKEFNANLSAYFQAWLKQNNNGSDIRYLANLKKCVKSLEACTISPSASPIKTRRSPLDPIRAASY